MICANCSDSFEPSKARNAPMYCSNACRQAAYRKRKAMADDENVLKNVDNARDVAGGMLGYRAALLDAGVAPDVCDAMCRDFARMMFEGALEASKNQGLSIQLEIEKLRSQRG